MKQRQAILTVRIVVDDLDLDNDIVERACSALEEYELMAHVQFERFEKITIEE